jgi:hypothetical protein
MRAEEQMRQFDYETDFFEWTQEQAARLRDAASLRLNVDLDWENLAEEVESLGRRDFRGLRSHVARIIEHLLKLEFSAASDPRPSWEESATLHRYEAELIMRDSPSLRNRLAERLDECYADGRRHAAQGFRKSGEGAAQLPPQSHYTIVQVLDAEWFPKNRQGLE